MAFAAVPANSCINGYICLFVTGQAVGFNVDPLPCCVIDAFREHVHAFDREIRTAATVKDISCLDPAGEAVHSVGTDCDSLCEACVVQIEVFDLNGLLPAVCRISEAELRNAIALDVSIRIPPKRQAVCTDVLKAGVDEQVEVFFRRGNGGHHQQ